MDELYLNNYKRKSFQWELWEYCRNHCQFCYIGADNLDTKAKRQLTSLRELKEILDNFDSNTYNNVSLIGGEFFQGECHTKEIEDKLLNILKQITMLYENKQIGSSWLTVTLTLGNQELLYKYLDWCRENKYFLPNKDYNSSGLWLCTSWDAKGRFHTKAYLDNWEYHMLNIHKKYPFVKFNTTIILTEPFLDLYLNNEFSFKKFGKKFNTTFFLKQPGLGTRFDVRKFGYNEEHPDEVPYEKAHWMAKQEANKYYRWNFFPHRKKMLDFLEKCKREDNIIFDRLFNIRYRADELRKNLNDLDTNRKTQRDKNSPIEATDQDSDLNWCGHIYNYVCYIDDKDWKHQHCCMCDKLSMAD